MNLSTIETPLHRFRWIDLTNPSMEELMELAQTYDIHKTSIQDCMEPYHLPKFEALENHAFMILRCREDAAPLEAFTILELTRKIAIFSGKDFLITIHRREIPFLNSLKIKWEKRLQTYEGHPRDHLLMDIMSEVFDSFDRE